MRSMLFSGREARQSMQSPRRIWSRGRPCMAPILSLLSLDAVGIGHGGDQVGGLAGEMEAGTPTNQLAHQFAVPLAHFDLTDGAIVVVSAAQVVGVDVAAEVYHHGDEDAAVRDDDDVPAVFFLDHLFN